jgi:hypothetical protein
MTEEELLRTTTKLYGAPLDSWRRSAWDIAKYMSNLPPIAGKQVPLITFVIFAKKFVRTDNAKYVSAIFSRDNATRFTQELPIMEESAKVQASVDSKNFESEVKAFGDTEAAITKPHLNISPIYRYAAAVQNGYIFAVTDKMLEEAIAQLRANPYLYFAYGEDYVELMPIPWEAL